MRVFHRVLPVLLLALATASHAAPRARCTPVVADAWVRLTPMMPMGAGFFSLRNRCASDVVLTGVASPDFGAASMHETRLEGGISRMRRLPRLVIHPGQRLDFRPGGRHLMLMTPAARVVPGSRVRIELQFADGRTVPVEFGVRSAAP